MKKVTIVWVALRAESTFKKTRILSKLESGTVHRRFANVQLSRGSVRTALNPATTAAAAPMATVPRTWQEVGSKTACDTGAGEVYMQSSPGKGSSLELCKQTCEDTLGCQSITYFNNGWCSHYSTPCTNTKGKNKAFAYRLSADAGNVATTQPGATVGKFL